MQVLNPAEVQPFSTDNAALAYCLYMADVPFIDDREPCRNRYDVDVLFRIGGGEKDRNGTVIKPSRYKGMGPEDAARAAYLSGLKGVVEYLFKQTPELRGLLRAYTEQENELKAAKEPQADMERRILKEVAGGQMGESETLVRLTCITLKTRKHFMDLWKALPPHLKIDNPGETRVEDCMVRNHLGQLVPGKQLVSPGYKVYSLNLSAEKRKHIGV